ncbi:bifunctional riboflavin kinase/FMN adenylyltransferase [Peribacillus asahii]|uniref:FAD synthase n=1 Tax=Peribacillus asahii TaxID=228899 RepID=A0A398BKY8_9BACI|nr:bifunctional riboflavin kinase/FMN adenylyltransferase [Peribacillus asahii]
MNSEKFGILYDYTNCVVKLQRLALRAVSIQLMKSIWISNAWGADQSAYAFLIGGTFLKVIHITNSNRDAFLLEAKPCVMALGFFDGVHLGHQAVIKAAKRVADEKKLPLVIMSFFPHPKEVLSNGKKIVSYLMPLVDKQKKFKALGVEIFYMVQFNFEFAGLTPKQFVQNYLLDFGAQQIVAGFDFTYGCRGEGNMDRVQADSDGRIESIKVKKIEFEGEKISSTLIRNLICSGKVEEIPYYLGESYQIEGTVSLNKYSADIIVNPHYSLPSSGIYEVTVTNGRETWKQEALILNGQLTFMLSKSRKCPLKENETIRIYWERRLPNGWSTSLEQSHHYSQSVVS